MKLVNTLTAAVVVAIAMVSCQKEKNTDAVINYSNNTPKADAELSAREGNKGFVYTLSNQTSGNRVMVYSRAGDGSLTFDASYSSGGNGTGGGLGNQGAVIISNGEEEDDDDILLAVNPGSNSISSFKINGSGLTLKSTVSSGGMRPVSITRHDDIVFVLNGGGTNNVSGFKLKENGMLQPIANSTRPLSAASTGPAQVSFTNNGKVIVITEKATNKIVTYTVNEDGMPGAMHVITSSSPTPFGFAVGKNNKVFISEAVGGAPGASVLSSYNVGNDGAITLVTGSIGAGQSAACWVVITNNGKYAYATNTASNNLSTFNVNNAGSISVSQAISATTDMGPIDAALSINSKYLYILNSGGHSISAFAVANNGALSSLPTAITGLANGFTGLAAN